MNVQIVIYNKVTLQLKAMNYSYRYYYRTVSTHIAIVLKT